MLSTAEEKGEKKGLKKGEIRKAIEVATKMIKRGMPMDLIIELSGLSEEEIKKITA
jgi:predicted transposase/invertase (TIGR01784 family)